VIKKFYFHKDAADPEAALDEANNAEQADGGTTVGE
jgi:hypothetical protein